MAIPRSPSDCTRKLIVVDWPIRSLIFNPKLRTLGRWAALHLNSLQCGIAFEGMGLVGKTALCLLIRLQSRRAGFGAYAIGIFKKELFWEMLKHLPSYVSRKHYTCVVPTDFFHLSYRSLSDQNLSAVLAR